MKIELFAEVLELMFKKDYKLLINNINNKRYLPGGKYPKKESWKVCDKGKPNPISANLQLPCRMFSVSCFVKETSADFFFRLMQILLNLSQLSNCVFPGQSLWWSLNFIYS